MLILSIALQGADVVDSQLLHRIMPIWHSGTIFTCSLTEDQASVVQQVGSLGPQQLAILWQVLPPCSLLCCLRHLC